MPNKKYFVTLPSENNTQAMLNEDQFAVTKDNLFSKYGDAIVEEQTEYNRGDEYNDDENFSLYIPNVGTSNVTGAQFRKMEEALYSQHPNTIATRVRNIQPEVSASAKGARFGEELRDVSTIDSAAAHNVVAENTPKTYKSVTYTDKDGKEQSSFLPEDRIQQLANEGATDIKSTGNDYVDNNFLVRQDEERMQYLAEHPEEDKFSTYIVDGKEISADEYLANRDQYVNKDVKRKVNFKGAILNSAYESDMALADYDYLNQAVKDFDNGDGAIIKQYEDMRKKLASERIPSWNTKQWLKDHKGEYEEAVKKRDELKSSLKENKVYKEIEAARQEAIKSTKEEAKAMWDELKSQYREATFNFTQEGWEKEDASLALAAREMYKKAYRAANAPTKEDSGAESFFKGAGNTLGTTDFWSLGLTSIASNLQLKGAFDAIREKFGTLNEIDLEDENKIDAVLSPEQKELIKSFVLLGQAEALRADDTNTYYGAGQTATESLGFMAQFIATGGIADIAVKGATKGLSKWIISHLGKTAFRAIDAIATPIMKTAVMLPLQTGTYKELTNQLVTFDEEGKLHTNREALANTLKNQSIEIWSEQALDPVLSLMGRGLVGGVKRGAKALGKTAALEALMNSKAADYAKIFFNNDLVKKLADAGFNGYAEEIGEEFLGAGVQQLLGWDDEAWANITNQEQINQMMVAFAPMSLLGLGGSMIAVKKAAKDYQQYIPKVREILLKSGLSEEEVDRAINREGQSLGDIALNSASIVSKALANNQMNLTSDELEALRKISWHSARNDVANSIIEGSKQQARGVKNQQIESVLGNHEYTDESGKVTTVVRESDGETLYLVAKGDTQYNFIEASTGNTGSVLLDDVANENGYHNLATRSKNNYLDEEVEKERKEIETKRMEQEKAQKFYDVKSRIQLGAKVNVEVNGENQEGFIRDFDGANAVTVETQDAQGNKVTKVLTFAEAGKALGVDMNVLDDGTIEGQLIADAQEKDMIAKAANRRGRAILEHNGKNYVFLRASANITDNGTTLAVTAQDENGNEVTLDDVTTTELTEMTPVESATEDSQLAAAQAEQKKADDKYATDIREHTVDGAVQEDKLLADSPRSFARYSDEKHGTAYTSQLIDSNVATITEEVARDEQTYMAETSSDKKQELLDKLNEKKAHLAELMDLQKERAPRDITSEGAPTADVARAEVQRYRAMGLTDGEILDMARQSSEAAQQRKGSVPAIDMSQPAEAIVSQKKAVADALLKEDNTSAYWNAIAEAALNVRAEEMEARAVENIPAVDALLGKRDVPTVITTLGTYEEMLVQAISDYLESVPEEKREEESKEMMNEKAKVIAQAKAAEFATRMGFTSTLNGFNLKNGTVFIFADNFTPERASRITSAYNHERRHALNRANKDLVNQIMGAASKDELATLAFGLSGSKYYLGLDADVLADEVSAMALENEEQLKKLATLTKNEELIKILNDEFNTKRDYNDYAQQRNGVSNDNTAGAVSSDGSIEGAGAAEVAGQRHGTDGRSSEGTFSLSAEERELVNDIDKTVGGDLENGDGSSAVRFSTSAAFTGAGLQYEESDENSNVAVYLPDGRKFDGHNLLSWKDLQGVENSILRYMMNDAIKLGTVSKAKERKIWQRYTDMLNAYLVTGLAENGGFESLASKWQWLGETIYKTVATNSDKQYSFSLDITRVCKKNEAVISAIAAMQRKLGYGITPAQIMDIYLTTMNEGYQVPCPVCYVFTRYIRNGKYATIMINGQRKYGDMLVNPATLTEEQRQERIQYWVNELDRVQKENNENDAIIKAANKDITELPSEIDKIAKPILEGKVTPEEEEKLREQIASLDAKYKAALNVVSQSSLDSWITQFAIHKEKIDGEEKWVLWEDSYEPFPEEMALDLRETATVLRKYPAIQRFRKSRGAAAGKEITFAANNELGEVAMMLGSMDTPNWYKMAAEATSEEERRGYLAKASKRFKEAHDYAQRQSLRGGQRMWSWSDNIERLAPDVFYNIMQLEMLGGALQSYSKQLEGIKMVASMGGYVNGSLMAKGNGYREIPESEVEIVDGIPFVKDGDFFVEQNGFRMKTPAFYNKEDGKYYVLEFDKVIGVDPFGETAEDGHHLKGLFELNSELDKAGNIIVGMNDLHIRMAMADDRIFFIIPWHSSGANQHILAQMYDYLAQTYGQDVDGNQVVATSKDYTTVQEEKYSKNVKPELNEFWEDHYNNAREYAGYGKVAGKDFKCGIKGGVQSGKDTLSESQQHYKELRDAIFVGVKVQVGTKNGEPVYKNVPVDEAGNGWIEEIKNDEFLSQVYAKVGGTVDEGTMTSTDTGFIYPYEYWDMSSTYETADINAARYMEYCRRLGYKPKFCGKLSATAKDDFGNFVDDKGYWKLLIDRRMYDRSGKFQDLTTVDTDGFTPDLADPEKSEQEFHVTTVADSEGNERIADKTIAMEEERYDGGLHVDYDLTLGDALEEYKSASRDVKKYIEKKAKKAKKSKSKNATETRMSVTKAVQDEMEVIEATARVNGIWLKAPNGADTKLTPEQWKMVRTTNFKNWFGDWENEPANASKVVDENGEPMVVYHGTTENKFNEFKAFGVSGTMGFFTDDKQAANLFGKPWDMREWMDEDGNEIEPNIFETYLNMRNPAIIDSKYSIWSYIPISKDLYDAIDSQDKSFDENGYYSSTDTIVRYYKNSDEHDGVIFQNVVGEHDQDIDDAITDYVPFGPNQIKSATENNGEFSAENNDIRFSVTAAINVSDKDQAYTDQILNGDKTIETRNTNSLDRFIGQRVALIRTGVKGGQMVVGYVDIIGKKEYSTEEEFRADEDKHLVTGGEYYQWKGKKVGYILANPVREEKPYKPSKQSRFSLNPIVSGGDNQVRFSMTLSDKVLSVFNDAIAGKKGDPVRIANLSKEGREYLGALSGLSLKEDTALALDYDDLRHIYNDHYSENEKDNGNNVPLSDNDIRRMIDVFAFPTKIYFFYDERYDHRPSFIFLMESSEGEYNLMEVSRTKKGLLIPKSFYKNKKSHQQRVMDLESLLSTPEAYSAVSSSNAKIPILLESPRVNLKFRITPQQDAAYMQAVESGDMETAQRMVDEAAEIWAKDSKVRGTEFDAPGGVASLRKMYHGTMKYGFNVFNTYDQENNIGAHFGSTTAANLFADANNNSTSRGENSGVYGVYLNLKNPYDTFDWFGQDDAYPLLAAEEIVDEMPDGNDKVKAQGIINEMIKYPGMEWATGNLRDDSNNIEEAYLTNREDGASYYNKLRKVIEIAGYDGLSYMNDLEDMVTVEHGDGHTVERPAIDYVALYPSQIKSADPVTYDNDGNVIPLSKRFDSRNDDIRFSVVADINDIDTARERKAETNKQEVITTDDVRFSISRNNKQIIKAWYNKANPDGTDNDHMAGILIDYIEETFDDPTAQLAAARWYINGVIVLPDEDVDKVEQAVEVAKKHKEDPLRYKTPMEIIDKFGAVASKEQPIDPDTVDTLHLVKKFDSGLAIYDVDESQESRENMRKIINTHFGKECSPWCLLQGNGEGELTDQSAYYWNDVYTAYTKQVAFVNGKLVAFSANSTEDRLWWDRNDKAHADAVPSIGKIKGDKLGRSAEIEYSPETGEQIRVGKKYKGSQSNGTYREWNENDVLIEESNWKDYVRDGMQMEWQDNGKLRSEERYENGTPIYENQYNYDGILVYTCKYKNGEMRFATNYRQGVMVSDTFYAINSRQSHKYSFQVPYFRTHYNSDGAVSKVEDCEYNGGVQADEVYGPDGKVMERRMYQNEDSGYATLRNTYASDGSVKGVTVSSGELDIDHWENEDYFIIDGRTILHRKDGVYHTPGIHVLDVLKERYSREMLERFQEFGFNKNEAQEILDATLYGDTFDSARLIDDKLRGSEYYREAYDVMNRVGVIDNAIKKLERGDVGGRTKWVDDGDMGDYSSHLIADDFMLRPAEARVIDYQDEMFKKYGVDDESKWDEKETAWFEELKKSAEIEKDRTSLGNKQSKEVRFSIANNNQQIFVSNAMQAVEGLNMGKASGEQWLKAIQGKGGLKAGEDKWLGLSEFLDGKDKVTKDDLLDYIKENAIKIEETEYMDEDVSVHDKLVDMYGDIVDEAFMLSGNFNPENGSVYVVELDKAVEFYNQQNPMTPILDEEWEDETALIDKLESFALDLAKEAADEVYNRPINSTRLQYTTEGLENKREIALTVPTIEPYNANDNVHFGDAGEGRAIAWIRFGDTKTRPESNRIMDRLEGKYGVGNITKNITSEEWKELVASKRSPEARVLVIDEIQSKRHQDGRENGYKSDQLSKMEQDHAKAVEETEKYWDELVKKYGIDTPSAMTEEEKEHLDELTAKARNLFLDTEEIRAKEKSAVPAAPFEKNWHELAMKRMLRLAAEEGYDKIAWTNGNMQTERYNLGGVVTSIDCTLDDTDYKSKDFALDLNNSDKYPQISVNTETGMITSADNVLESAVNKPLADLVGKEVAMKMLAMNQDESLTGDGLRVGGEGMKGFYDDILPRFMNKYGKKWGIKVEDITLPGLQNENGWHSIDVTPEMKESVMDGQVMFSLVTPQQDEEYKAAVESGNYKKVEKLLKQAAKESMPNTKVVDKKGNPLLVYHGTPNADFNVFEGDFLFFTKDRTNAGEYEGKRTLMGPRYSKEGHTIPAFLNIENPFEIDVHGGWNRISRNRVYDALGIPYEQEYVTKTDKYFGDFQELKDEKIDTIDVCNLVKERGYDGIIFKNLADHMFSDNYKQTDVYVAFSPNQVKGVGTTYNTFEGFFGLPYRHIENTYGGTYNDNGKLIPLSERFNTKSNDIRFSLSERKANETPYEFGQRTVNGLLSKYKMIADGISVYGRTPGDYNGDYDGEIRIFVDTDSRVANVEGTFFHENVHAAYDKYNWDPEYPLGRHILEALNANDEIDSVVSQLNNIGYDTDSLEQELSARVIERILSLPGVEDLVDRLAGEDKDKFVEYLNGIGYDPRKEELVRGVQDDAPRSPEESNRVRMAPREEGANTKRLRENGILFSESGAETDTERDAEEQRRKAVAEIDAAISADGLTSLIEETKLADALIDIYTNADPELREKLTDRARDYRFDSSVLWELSHYAEQDTLTEAEERLLESAREKFSSLLGVELTGDEALWFAYNHLHHNDATINAKAHNLSVGRSLGFGGADLNDKVEQVREFLKAAEDTKANVIDKYRAMRQLTSAMEEISKAMSARANYDRLTTQKIVSLANMLVNSSLLDNATKMDVKRLMKAIREATGRRNLKTPITQLYSLMLDNQLRNLSKMLDKVLKTKEDKVNAQGVVTMAKLDANGQLLIKAFREFMDIDAAQIDERISEVEGDLNEADSNAFTHAKYTLRGLNLAKHYREEVANAKAEEKRIMADLAKAEEDHKAGKMDDKSFRQFKDECYNSIRESKMERLASLARITQEMMDLTAASRSMAVEFMQREQERINGIHHNANSDMEGRPDNAFRAKPSFSQRLANWPLLRFAFATMPSFDQMLRMFGNKSANGEGYLWNRFMRQWIDNTGAEFANVEEAHKILDSKVSEVFGKDMRWSDLYDIEKKMPMMDATFFDEGQIVTHKLTQGNLLYILMANKMSDGRVKLRKMGITEEMVEDIRNQMDPRFLTLADWIQDEFLPSRRKLYNEVYERMFGAPMSAIENYFPLRILSTARTEEVDVANPQNEKTNPSTITGNIIKRVRNTQPLDILGADAFSVVIEHINQMEHWRAFAEWNRDLGTLLSYKRFRNQVLNMSSIYGSGQELWNNFRDVARVAAGEYKAKGKTSLDSAAMALAKGATAAKISLRVFTAMKQFLSFPAYFSEANPMYLAKNVSMPWAGWNWCMDNLPMFRKRWLSRQAGDHILSQSADWKSEIVAQAARIGMSPNAFVDALTVSMGAYAIYQTKLDKYLNLGFSQDKAEAKAKQDAVVLYNETQQSNENAFMSPMQMDRSWMTAMFSVFRNSSIGYERQLVDAVRNWKRRLSPGYRSSSIEFMSKQMEREGLTPNQALIAATRVYNKQGIKDLVRLGIFGYVMQFAWNLGSQLPYILFGDDDDDKKKSLEDVATHSIFGGVEGFTGGNLVSEALNMIARGESLRNWNPTLMPLTSDFMNIISKMDNDDVTAINDMVNLGVQIGFGINPQTITDGIVAVIDACNGDVKTAHEAMILAMRLLQVPQSQIEKIYLDEVNLSGNEASELTIPELAKRYADYKILRNAPLTHALYEDTEVQKLEDKYIKKFESLAKERLTNIDVDEEYKQMEEDTKKMDERLELLKEMAEAGDEEAEKERTEIFMSPEFGMYQNFKDIKDAVNKELNNAVKAPTLEKMSEHLSKAEELKSTLAGVSTDYQTNQYLQYTKGFLPQMESLYEKYVEENGEFNAEEKAKNAEQIALYSKAKRQFAAQKAKVTKQLKAGTIDEQTANKYREQLNSYTEQLNNKIDSLEGNSPARLVPPELYNSPEFAAYLSVRGKGKVVGRAFKFKDVDELEEKIKKEPNPVLRQSYEIERDRLKRVHAQEITRILNGDE